MQRGERVPPPLETNGGAAPEMLHRCLVYPLSDIESDWSERYTFTHLRPQPPTRGPGARGEFIAHSHELDGLPYDERRPAVIKGCLCATQPLRCAHLPDCPQTCVFLETYYMPFPRFSIAIRAPRDPVSSSCQG
jgi:hypothetical protein